MPGMNERMNPSIYQLVHPLVLFSDEDPSIVGGITTSDPGGSVDIYHLTGRTGELLVLGLVLIAWLLSIAVFLHRWRHLRILPPRALLFTDTTPKNLDRVKVVDCPADSVIYRGYTKGIASALQARIARIRRTFSKRLTNLPLAMVSVRHRPSMGRPSFYGRQSHDRGLSCNERPSHVGRHRMSTFYRAPRWSRTSDLAPTSTLEVMESIPEVMQTIPEVAASEVEVTQCTPDMMPETATSIPEVAISRSPVGHSRPEVITSLAEVVIEFAHEKTSKRELNSSP